MKKVITMITVLFSMCCCSQTEKATLYLKDGKILEGVAKIRNESVILFKTDNNSKKKTRYDHKTVKRIDLVTDSIENMYKYKIVPSVGPILVKVVSEGESQLSLYSQSVTIKTGGGGHWSNGVFIPGAGETVKRELMRYYIGKGSEDYVVVKLWTDAITKSNKHFIKTVPAFFEDCPSLIDKIKSKTYNMFNVPEMIDYYNQECMNK